MLLNGRKINELLGKHMEGSDYGLTLWCYHTICHEEVIETIKNLFG